MTALNYVTLLIASQDAGQDATAGQVSITPTSEVIAAGVTVVSSQPVVRTLSGGSVSVQLVATDNTGTSPASRNWAYQVLLPGQVTPLEYYVDFAGGASQRLDSLTPLNGPPAVLSASYLPLPSGTPTAGYVPTATGTGEGTAWAPSGTGGSGYPASPVVSGAASAGNVLTASDATHASWQPPAAGGGTVTSVSVVSANGLAGSVATPTTTPAITLSTSVTGVLKGNGTAVSAAAAGTDYLAPSGSGAALTGITAAQVGALSSSSTVTIAQGGTGQVTQQAALDAVAGAVTSGSYLRGSGTHVQMSAIQAADVPTLNQSTTGNAATATNLAGGATVPAYLAPHVATLTDAATVAVNAALGNDFRLLTTSGVGASRTIAAPSNPVDGQAITIDVQQDATGSRTVTWTSGAGGFSFGTDGAPTLSTAASAVDTVGFRYHGGLGKWICLGWKLGYS